MTPNTVACSGCTAFLKTLPDCCVDSCVTDPPYELGFMGKKWDKSGIANSIPMWAEVLRVLKPGGHLLSFGGTRTYHRMTCAIEDAGFEIRDCIQWIYGSGFPKSLDVSKAIDKTRRRDYVQAAINLGIPLPGRSVTDWTEEGHAPGNKWWEKFKASLPSETWGQIEREVIRKGASGTTAIWNQEGGMGNFTITAPATDAAKQWDGWGTALKPACEPCVVARKPLIGTVAENVQQHGTGALNIDGCRVDYSGSVDQALAKPGGRATAKSGALAGGVQNENERKEFTADNTKGRWPANLIHDGSEEVLAGFPQAQGAVSNGKHKGNGYSEGFGGMDQALSYGDTGSAARFFYCAKASKSDRGEGNNHPTVKPLELMRYLVRLVTPPGGIVLDHFAGSGTTLVAARQEGFQFLGCDMDEKHISIIEQRLALELPFGG